MAKNVEEQQREERSFLMPRDPSIGRLYRPKPEKPVTLFANIEEEDYKNGLSSFYSDEDYEEDISETASESTNSSAATSDNNTIGASVYLRLRPIECPSSSYAVSEENNVLITKPPVMTNSNKTIREKHYSFTSIFDGNISQKEVYEKCIDQYMKADESFTIMTYGTSGSGKTFTLLGDVLNPGIIPRFMEAIFTLYKENISPQPTIKLINGQVTILTEHDTNKENLLRNNILSCCTNLVKQYEDIQRSIQLEHEFVQRNHSDDAIVFTWITFVEIYNEMVYDLLSFNDRETSRHKKPSSLKQTTRKALKISYNNGGGFISGVTSIYVRNSLEALMLLRYGQQKITYASTAINENSSRSHCIFILDVLTFYPSGLVKPNSYTFCDLAGTERQYKTGNAGNRFKETQCINTSLMVLGRCLDAASQKIERLPLRDSKLTMLLQSALQGKEKLTMIVNVAPIDDYYEENLHVLNFASIAQNIVFKSSNIEHHHRRYSALLDNGQNWKEQQQQRINELEDELKNLAIQHKHELDTLEVNLRKELVDSCQDMLAQTKKRYEREMAFNLNSQKIMYEAKIASLSKRCSDLEAEFDELEEENEALRNKLAAYKNTESPPSNSTTIFVVNQNKIN